MIAAGIVWFLVAFGMASELQEKSPELRGWSAWGVAAWPVVVVVYVGVVLARLE
jgi:hypothetical protein